MDGLASISDTEEQMIVALRSKTPAERLAIAHGMWRHARQMITLVVQSEHSDWQALQINEEVARRLSHGAV